MEEGADISVLCYCKIFTMFGIRLMAVMRNNVRKVFIALGSFTLLVGILRAVDFFTPESRSVETLAIFSRKILPSRSSKPTNLALLSKECPYLAAPRTGDVARAVSEAASTYALHDELLYAVMFVESKCNSRARSERGAVGLMQLMPETARALGVGNPYLIRNNILGGAKYLSQLKDSFNGNLDLALAAYNAGPAAVKYYASVPPYRETREYLQKVKRIYRHLRETKNV